MKRLLAVAALAALALAAAAYGGGRHGPSAVSSSRLVDGGKIRITATVATPVQAGHDLGVAFSIENVSRQTREIQLCCTSLWLVVRSPDGTRYDTRVPLRDAIWPFIRPLKLRAGQTVTRSAGVLRVRWSGPLRITPGWNRTSLPPLAVGVTSPGPPRDDRTELGDVVSATGGLLDRCRPQAPGIAVTGEIDAPEKSAPPMRARCSIGLRHERRFDVAQVLIETPPGYHAIHLRSPYEQFTWPKTGKSGGLENAEAVGWLFVVTRDGATSVDSTAMETTKPGKPMAPDWQWTTAGFQGHPGGSKCGGTGGGGGGYPGPLVEFVSVCPG